jgi:folylpolyglutamate synthase/dihydropteroate synthase
MPARYEEKPLAINQDKIIRFIYDGAHTPLSVFMTMDTIIRHFKIKQDESGHEVLRGEACLILSFADGKKIEEMLHILVPYFQNVIITGCGSFKKSNPEEIYKLAKEVSPSHDISMIEDPVKAVTRAMRRVDKFGTVFVIGSFYLCAEIKNALKELGYES